MEEKKRALDYSLKLLGFRSRSIRELETRLRKCGFSEEILEGTISELKGQGYLDDLAFARMWISQRVRLKNLGRNRLRRELLIKGVDKEIVDAELSSCTDQDEKERALAIARKKCLLNKDLNPTKKRQRVYQFLVYKGFDVSIAGDVSRKIFQSDEEYFDQE